MAASITQAEFESRARAAKGDKYSYDRDFYKGMNEEYLMYCPDHGEFTTTPARHINQGSGCKGCLAESISLNKRKRHQEKLEDKQGELYKIKDWLSFEGIRDNVLAKCKNHGEYENTYYSILNTKHGGCPKCKSLLEGEVFIKKANKKHGEGRYIYNVDDYQCSRTLMKIWCPVHEKYFEQRPSAHLQGQNCPECGKQHNSENSLSSLEDFIVKCREVHGDKFDYSQTVYKGRRKEFTVICKYHGEIHMYPNNHLVGQGCTECSKEVYRKRHEDQFLKKVSENTFLQHLDFSKARYITNSTPVDIYCKDHNEWFKRTPNRVLDSKSGLGCATCGKVAMNRWSLNSLLKIPKITQKSGYFYTGRITNVAGIKLGITNNLISRKSHYKRDLKVHEESFEYIKNKESDYFTCALIEVILKKFYVSDLVTHKLEFGGKNEVYNIKNTKLLEDIFNGRLDSEFNRLSKIVTHNNHTELLSFVEHLKSKEEYHNIYYTDN